MPSFSSLELSGMQHNTKNVRNLCVLAHVDHGKTTFSDCLISSNGIISDKLAGKIRYLDNRKDEQERLITMKSSSISLLHRSSSDEPFLINLIDSPGHVDFSGEVSSALRVCDGSFLLVDVVEGVCAQTETVLRQAWKEKIKPCLIMNKMDRLVLELDLTPEEAFSHLKKVLEKVNVLVATLLLEEAFDSEMKKNAVASSSSSNPSDSSHDTKSKVMRKGEMSITIDIDQQVGWRVEELDDEDVYFSPEKGNVIFASAVDGWGFRVEHFAALYSKKMGFNMSTLKNTLWGEFFLDLKAKKIHSSQKGNLKPMFAELVLKPIWQLYEATSINKDVEKLKKICSVINVEWSPRYENMAANDPRNLLATISRQWLPLSTAALDMAVDHLPSPITGQEKKVSSICKALPVMLPEEKLKETLFIQQCMIDCKKSGEKVINQKGEEVEPPLVIFISKMITVPTVAGGVLESGPRIAQPKARKTNKSVSSEVEPDSTVSNVECPTEAKDGLDVELNSSRLPKPEPEFNESLQHLSTIRARMMAGEKFIGFARIFSGTVRIGQTVHVMGPRFDPLNPEKHHAIIEVEELFLMMGRGLEHLQEVPAGNVFGIGGKQLSQQILKTGTLSSSINSPLFSPMVFSRPIMRVAVEPVVPAEMPILIDGLKLLNQADASVEIMVQETGEHVIAAAGEVHLERCKTDLNDLFAPIALKFSSPIVGFREGIILHSSLSDCRPGDYVWAKADVKSISAKDTKKEASRAQLAYKRALVSSVSRNKIFTVRLRALPLPFPIRDFIDEHSEEIRQVFAENFDRQSRLFLMLQEKMLAKFIESGSQWTREFEKIWSFGPRRMGSNILINHIADYSDSPFWKSISSTEEAKKLEPLCDDQKSDDDDDDDDDSDGNDHKNSGSTQTEQLVICTDTRKQPVDAGIRPSNETAEEEAEEMSDEKKWRIAKLLDLDSTIVAAFQLATQAGPLCEEPMMGVAVFIEDVEIQNKPEKFDEGGPLKGQVMATVKEGVRLSFQKQSPRLIEPFYNCTVQVSTEQYGNACAVLTKRRSKITGEESKDGANIFVVSAKLPVASSFGIALEMMHKTSGSATVQLTFSHWEMLDVDPDFVPTTQEELEKFGTNTGGIAPNLSRQMINEVRKRKGLHVEEQLVEHADKQRTLSKKK